MADKDDKDRAGARRMLLFLEPLNLARYQQPNLSCHA
jgi:hypothetical protein